MNDVDRPPRVWWAALVATLGLGATSRLVPIGLAAWDEAFGDAAYAAAVTLLLRATRPSTATPRVLVAAVAVMIAVETFQLTGIAAEWRATGSPIVKVVAVAMGTVFVWSDLLSYGVGIGVIGMFDRCVLDRHRVSRHT